ncbi:hypothetical protein I533_12130 [Alteromonas mediterranea MED64]|uniref:Uncharacterized protein n=1 Tax=Alteromonas mediterranea (strain DSM 17117 / CIP 110805 / LMG 28347 / Deep ecotype) TaxID=1774373 RepID=T2DMM0_ALTMD|nr:hypothetical protein [Alteromonas mediterranea]AGP82386.1 hypothetical protein I533_12130 [Alteromonas mediterranea MED64]AGV54047.1 hypothetical protein MADE_000001022220 [Alteromonas mediterranea DE]MBR9782793.1 hypothetical protein [Gammaproteobacteria bacterium]CAH1204971.1 hypothetical protein ISS312_03475 [Alteromonas mediterranea]
MSNKNTPNSKSVSALDSNSTARNGIAATPIKSSPLFGWLYAGTDLLSAKLDQVAGMVSQRIDDTHETINAMQTKGLEVESELRQTLNPFAIVDSAQKLVSSTPLFSMFSGGQKRQQKEQQLEALNAKVDLLVEQVALLAAKEAAKQVKAKETVAKPATAKASVAANTPRARKTSAATTKAASKPASTSTKPATSKSTASSKASSTTSKSTTTKTSANKTTAKTTAPKTSGSKAAPKSTSASSTTSTEKSSTSAANSNNVKKDGE